MEYGIDKYSALDFFMKIENLLNIAPVFINEDEKRLYYKVRFKLFKESLLDRFDLITIVLFKDMQNLC